MRKVLFIIIWSISFALLSYKSIIFGGAWHGVARYSAARYDVVLCCRRCIGWCFYVSLTLYHFCTFQKFNFHLFFFPRFSSLCWCCYCCCLEQSFHIFLFVSLDFVFLLCITLPFTNRLTTIFLCLHYVILGVLDFFLLLCSSLFSRSFSVLFHFFTCKSCKTCFTG